MNKFASSKGIMAYQTRLACRLTLGIIFEALVSYLGREIVSSNYCDTGSACDKAHAENLS